MASWAGRAWPFFLALVSMLSLAGRARALQPHEVPEPLRPWIRWVEDTEAPCPVIGEDSTCVWPGVLGLDLDERGGRFRLEVTLDRRMAVPLPGSRALWPQDVTVTGGVVAVVLAKDGTPTVTLAAGSYEVRGAFAWNRLPEELPVPPRLALLELRLGGKVVARPKRDRGRLLLVADPALDAEPESLGLTVHRHLRDGVPFRVDTRLMLTVSGRAREVLLGNVLLEGSVPLSLQAGVPVRLEQGLLYAQVFPGRHEIRFDAVLPTPPDRLSRPSAGATPALPFWPKNEIWVFTADAQLRQVDVTGARGIDPALTELPDEWKALPAYSIEAGGGLALETRRRGEPDAAPNRLDLSRELWLDVDGDGYTVRDQFSGTMNRDWRLDLETGRLGRVVVGGTDQLVTTNPRSGRPGVELRDGALNVTAEWRASGGIDHLPAVGWSENVQHLQTRVHMPPGWRILSASGVDSMSETWLSNWDLFALFFVLVVALSIGKLLAPGWGVLALLTLVLTHGENGAPFASWLCVVVGVALCRVVPPGWFRRILVTATGAAGIALLLIAAAFAVQQIRAALYPQIEGTEDWFEFEDPIALTEEAAVVVEQKEGGTGVRSAPASKSARAYADAAQSAAPVVQRQQDPEAVIQTGPGVPTWSFRSWELSWSGPVHKEHRIRLYLLPPNLGRLVFVLRTLLCGLLAFALLRAFWRGVATPREAGRTTPVASAALLLLVPALTCALPGVARAQIPDQATLDQLKQRLSPPRDCAPSCVSVSRLELSANQNDVRIVLDAHAGDVVALQLPGPAQSWLPRTVSDNGVRSESLVLARDGFLYLRLSPGRHRVELSGPVGNELSLMLGEKPHRVSVDARDFLVEGVNPQGQVDGPLLLRRREVLERAASDTGVEAAVELPVWLAVTRTLDFGVTWTVHTKLERVGPVGGATAIRVPLLLGERVTTPGVTQTGREAVVQLNREDLDASFESTLTPSELVQLEAVGGRNLTERWVLRCSTVWHCETQGIAPTRHRSDGHHQPDFRPWPGEKLEISLTRPVAEEGRHTTVDAADLSLSPGVRLLHAELNLSVRTSTQGLLNLTLPAKSEIQELSVDGTAQPFAKGVVAVSVSLVPGAHRVRLSWQEPGGMTAKFVAPQVTVSGEVVNARVRVHLPEDRWLLFASGPSWGPAILFWGHLVLILLLAPVLGRLRVGQLRSFEWAILGLGLTQVPVVVAGLVVAWFFLIGWTAKARPFPPLAHNFAQLGLVLATLVFLGCLFGAVYDGLLSSPDMEVTGAGSTNRTLVWYVDRTSGPLPVPVVFSTSLWVWRVAMLAWALWLSWNLISWLRWGFSVFASDGLWKRTPRRPLPTPNAPPNAPPFVPFPTTPGPFPPTTFGRSGPGAPGPIGPGPSSESSPRADGFHPVGPTPGEGSQPITEAMVDEKTPIEPVVLMVEKRKLAEREETSAPRLEISTVDADPAELFSEDQPTDDPSRGDAEERPTLPRVAERKDEPFTFTAFDFAAASAALERIEATPDDASDGDWASGMPGQAAAEEPRAPGAPTEDSVKRALEPPSRVGTPPPKPPSVPPQAHHDTHPGFPPMATPPGGFTVEDLEETKRVEQAPPRSRDVAAAPREQRGPAPSETPGSEREATSGGDGGEAATGPDDAEDRPTTTFESSVEPRDSDADGPHPEAGEKAVEAGPGSSEQSADAAVSTTESSDAAAEATRADERKE